VDHVGFEVAVSFKEVPAAVEANWLIYDIGALLVLELVNAGFERLLNLKKLSIDFILRRLLLLSIVFMSDAIS